MTAAVKGLSGYVLGRMQAQQGGWWSTKEIADFSSVSLSQAGTCLARLVKAGLVEKGPVSIASGLRLWRRVPEVAKPLIGVGDVVQLKTTNSNNGRRGSVVAIDDGDPLFPIGVNLDDEGGPTVTWCRPQQVVRLPDTDPVPWDAVADFGRAALAKPKPPAAWAKDAGLPIRRGPPTPWEECFR